jgi:hypothetical protein
MPLIDYAELRRRFTLRDVLRLLEYTRWQGSGEQVYGPCPLGCSRSPRVCSLHLGRNIWHCNKCDQGGNHLDLWRMVKRLPIYEAALDLCSRLDLAVPWKPAPCSGGGQRRGHP